MATTIHKEESGIRDAGALRQLLTHVPDMVIKCDHSHAMPNVTHVVGVCMFADISGFTSLCETYANLGATDVACGTEKLTATLNTYIGKIVEDILINGGDVLKFAGDALLAMWKCNDSTSDLILLVNKAIICSLAIQEECDNYMTDVGVILRVKIAISVGKMHITYVGVADSKQFDLAGPAVEDVNGAEKWATPGSIILDRLAWANCEQSLFHYEVMEDGHHFKVNGIREQEIQTGEEDPTRTGVLLMSMAGMLSTKSVVLAIPPVGKRIFGPHVGRHFTKHHPTLKLPRIYKRRKNKENEPAAKEACGITGKLMRTGSIHNPDHRTDVYNLLNDQEIEDLRAYVSKPVLSKIDHGQDLQWLSEMRQVSVLFINMVLPKKGDLSSWALQQAFEIIYENVRRLRGNLNKVFSFDKGCTFLAVFGLPGEKHEDDQTRALKAGHRIIETLHTVMEITHEAIGLTTGRAFCGVVGHRDRHEYTVIGRKVNMAARLMVNYPGILSCDNETFMASKSKLKKEDFLLLPYKTLKGIADPEDVREYNKNHDRETEDDETEYPILGRELECQEMKKLLHIVNTDERQAGLVQHMVIIEGEAGIGKTRIMEEFMDIAEDENFKVDYVEADMAHAHTPYYVVQMLISILLELDVCRTPAEREHALKEHVTDEHLRNSLCLLNDLLGVHIPTNPKFSHMDTRQVTEHFHNLIFDIVHQVSVEQPCLFAVDNAQFIDHESWDFLEDLQKDSHAVLVLALRPFSAANPPCKSAVRMINNPKSKKFKLTGLDASLMSNLACQFMDVMYIPKELDTILQKKSHGVPSWCEQLIKDVLVSKIIVVVSETQAFNSEENVSESLSFAPIDGLRDKYQEICSQFQTSDESRPQSRPQSPFLRSQTPALPDVLEEDDGAMTTIKNTKARRGSLFTKLLIGNEEKAQKKRRMSTGSTTNEFYFDAEVRKSDDSRRSSLASEVSSVAVDLSPPVNKEYYGFNPGTFVPASQSAMPKDTHNVCIVTPGVDISNVLIPESVKDMVLARVDRMSPTEQVTLKCASILGMQFSRDLIEALVPMTCKRSLDVILYTLVRDGILECASLASKHQSAHNHHGFYDYNDPAHAQHHTHTHHHHHHHNVATSLHAPVLCGCYADEGNKVLNLTSMMTPYGPKKHCLFYVFVNIYVQETAYDVWLENQRKELHEKAAMFLESQAHKCRACGGGGFVPGQDSSQEEAQTDSKAESEASRRTSGRSTIMSSSTQKRRKAMEMREKVQSQGAFSSRAHERQSFTRPSNTELPNFESRSRANTINQDSMTQQENGTTGPEGLVGALGFAGQAEKKESRESWLSRITRKSSIKPKDEEVQLDESIGRMTLIEEEMSHMVDDDSNIDAVDLRRCQCAEVLASVFPQLVDHWRASGNKIKTFRYLTESGAAALTTSANMQALSHLYEVRRMFDEKTKDGEDIATKEDMVRVESLIGQALFQMNRLDEALLHFQDSLALLNKKQPTTSLGVHFRIRRESLRHYLHVLFPGYFMECAGDNSARLTEQARCLGHLSHVYHALHQNDRSLMAALQELNAAEEADENLHELLVAYAAVIECSHLVGWTSWAERYEKIGLQRCQDPRVYHNPENLITVGHLYSVSLSFRLATANIEEALRSGQFVMMISNKVNDLHMKISCLPLFVQALLLNGKTDKCFELLKELNYTAIEEEDSHGKALYMCGCFDLLLDAGQQVENINQIEEFTVQASNDPVFSGDMIPKFYLNACMALWYARKEEWEKAELFIENALAQEPVKLEDLMSVGGLIRIIETKLLHLRIVPKDKATKHDLKKKFHKLSEACHHYRVLYPRNIHLQAYQALIFSKASKARSLLKKCLSTCKASGLHLESEAIKRHQEKWFGGKQQSQSVYDGTTVFSLPKPQPHKRY